MVRGAAATYTPPGSSETDEAELMLGSTSGHGNGSDFGGNDLYELYLRFTKAEKQWVLAQLRQPLQRSMIEENYNPHPREHFFERLRAMDAKTRDRYCYILRRGHES